MYFASLISSMKKKLNLAVSEIDESECRKAEQTSPAIVVHALLSMPVDFRLPCENRGYIFTTTPQTIETYGGLCVK